MNRWLLERRLLPCDKCCEGIIAVQRVAAWTTRQPALLTFGPTVIEAEGRATTRRLTSRMSVGRWLWLLLLQYRVATRWRGDVNVLIDALDEAIGVAPLCCGHVCTAAPVCDGKRRATAWRVVAKHAPTSGRSGNRHAPEVRTVGEAEARRPTRRLRDSHRHFDLDRRRRHNGAQKRWARRCPSVWSHGISLL